MTIQEQLNSINLRLGEVLANQVRGIEDRAAVTRALGNFRDDITELMALGPQVRALAASVANNDKKIVAIEAWRQRKIGATGLLHAIGAGAGAVIGAGITLLLGTRH